MNTDIYHILLEPRTNVANAPSSCHMNSLASIDYIVKLWTKIILFFSSCLVRVFITATEKVINRSPLRLTCQIDSLEVWSLDLKEGAWVELCQITNWREVHWMASHKGITLNWSSLQTNRKIVIKETLIKARRGEWHGRCRRQCHFSQEVLWKVDQSNRWKLIISSNGWSWRKQISYHVCILHKSIQRNEGI